MPFGLSISAVRCICSRQSDYVTSAASARVDVDGSEQRGSIDRLVPFFFFGFSIWPRLLH